MASRPVAAMENVSPRLRDKVWAGGLGTRLGINISAAPLPLPPTCDSCLPSLQTQGDVQTGPADDGADANHDLPAEHQEEVRLLVKGVDSVLLVPLGVGDIPPGNLGAEILGLLVVSHITVSYYETL